MLGAANPPGMPGTDSWAPKPWGTLEQDLGQKFFHGQGWRRERLSSAVGSEVSGNSRIRPAGPWLYRDLARRWGRWDLGHHYIDLG